MIKKKETEPYVIFLHHCKSKTHAAFKKFIYSELKNGGMYTLKSNLLDGFDCIFESGDKKKINAFLSLPLPFHTKSSHLSVGLFKALSVDRLDIVDYVLHHPSVDIKINDLLNQESAKYIFLMGFCKGACYHEEMTCYLVNYIGKFNSTRLEHETQYGMLYKMLKEGFSEARVSHVFPDKTLKGSMGAQMIAKAWCISGSEPYFEALSQNISQDKISTLKSFCRIQREKQSLESAITQNNQPLKTYKI